MKQPKNKIQRKINKIDNATHIHKTNQHNTTHTKLTCYKQCINQTKKDNNIDIST